MIKSNTTICAASKCYSSLLTHPNKSFFGFPSDISLCKIWLENCGRTDLNLHHVSKRSHWRLCEDHFEDKWFTDASRKILKRKLNPVPTVFMNNINSLLPPGNDTDSIDDIASPMNFVECSLESGTEILPSHNQEAEIPNTKQICRFCLNEIASNFIDVFDDTDDARDIRKVCEVVLPNKVSINDGLPHKVCCQCIADLKNCWKLIKQFQNADEVLRSSAKYSSFSKTDDVTDKGIESEESVKEINADEFIVNKPTEKNSVLLQSNPVVQSLRGPSDFLDDININGSVNIQNDLKILKCAKPSTTANHKYPPERSKNEGMENKHSHSRKRTKPFSNVGDSNQSKHGTCNEISSEEILSKIIVMTHDAIDSEQNVRSIQQFTMDPLKLTSVANTRYSITLTWRPIMEEGVAYRLQLQDKLQGWITKYWGLKTTVEVGGLGPEESYHFRVGVTRPGEDLPCLWSKVLPTNTKDDLILVANLHRSVKYGNVNAVRRFINNRPYALETYNQLGQPTLAMATSPQVTALLLNSGVNVDQPARFTGRTALMQAAADGQVEVAAVLVERGASWLTRDRMGCTALHHAVDSSQLAVVDMALESAADLEVADGCGWTPLVRGVVLGSSEEVLRKLIAAGANIPGDTCLLLAVLSHRCDVARLLVEAGATTSDPQHLLTVAAAQGDNDIEILLRTHFQPANSKKDGKSTPSAVTPSNKS